MKNYYLLIIALCSVLCFSCKKDKELCEENGTGELKLENASDYKIEATVDNGEVYILEIGEDKVITLDIGNHSVDAVFVGLSSLGYGFDISECQQNTLKMEL